MTSQPQHQEMPATHSCCAPARPDLSSASASAEEPADGSAPGGSTVRRPAPSLVAIPAGSFRMGSADEWSYPGDGEGPIHVVELDAFEMAPTTVTNDEFAAFVDATGHVTDAERYGWSFVFAASLPDDFPPTQAAAQAPWWRKVERSSWRAPEGPHSSLDGRGDHPVVHVSWNDAIAYASWSGTRLPTEAQWEYAARGGRRGAVFPWGDELEPGGEHRMNVFQGTFPGDNSVADGFAGTAPAQSFPANGYGLYNMTGNVWEWCADWYDPRYYQRSPRHNPAGPDEGTHRVMRGGSYLCHASYCRRYRVAARSGNGPDSSTANLGFRVASAAAG